MLDTVIMSRTIVQRLITAMPSLRVSAGLMTQGAA